MIEKREENLEENKIKSARRKPARRNYKKRENKINEEAKNDVKKETKNIKKEVRRTTRRVNKEQEETKALVVRKESSLKELPREKALKKVTEKVGFKKPRLKIIPLGGLHEVGKNITVFQYDNEMIVVDCGLSFPEDDMLGVDLVIPDITYIIKSRKTKRNGNNTWTRRSYRKCTIFLKTSKHTNIWNKTYTWINKKQIRRT